MTKFKEFKLNDLFEIQKTKSLNTNALVSPTINNRYDYVTRTSENQGVLRQTGQIENLSANPANTFSLGLLQMDCFYRINSWYAGQFVRIIVPKFNINNYLAQYFTTIFQKLKFKFKSVLVRNVDNVFSNTLIKLPVKSLNDDEPDWNYMEQSIKQTEAPMLNAVDNWLRKKDAQLSTADIKSVLGRYQKADFQNFKISDLFEKLDTECLKSGNKKQYVQKSYSSEYNVPLINAKVGNNGVMYWTKSENFHTHHNCIGVVSDGAASTGLCYVYDREVGCLYNAFLMKLTNDDYKDNSNVNLYMKSPLEKVFRLKYSYTMKSTWSKVQNDFIKLPATSDGEPDYQLMEDYIKVIQQKYVRNLEAKLNHRIEIAKTLI